LNEENIREKTKEEAFAKIKEGMPKLVFTLIAAGLIWVFGNLAFMPLAEGISVYGWPLDKIISIIILSALVLIIIKSTLALTKMVDGISTILAVEISKFQPRFDSSSLKSYKSFLRGIVFSVVIILIYILIQDYLIYIHPALSGVLLLVIVIWSIFLLYQGGTKVSGEVTKVISDLGKDAVKLIKEEITEKEETSETESEETK